LNSRPTYLSALTFPRFALALIVVIYHFGMHLPFASEGFAAEFLKHGAVAVSFFFFLSGFVLAYNYHDSLSTKSFLLKRLVRLYPVYIVTFLVVLISMLYLKNESPGFIFGVAHALGLQAWIPGHALQVNFPAWSLSVEFFLYATFPLLHWVFQKLSWKNFVLIFVGLFFLGLAQYIYTVHYIYEPDRYYLEQFILYFPLFHFTTFTSGYLGGKLVHRLRNKSIHSGIFTAMAILGIVGFVVIMSTDNPWRLYAHNGGMIPFFMLICLGLSFDKSILAKTLGRKPMVYLGDISYGIYMWQFPVYLWFSFLMAEEQLSLVHFLIYLVLLIFVATISFRWLEQPLRKRML
jgi:peptidoglycan/LPS O-acetylase OafA/YrhL